MRKKTHAKALPLFGKTMLVIANREQYQGTGEKPQQTEEDLRKIKANMKEQKSRRKLFQKEAEKIQTNNDTAAMSEIVRKNNAGLRHIATFINMVEFAQKNGRPIALGELRKKSTEEDAVKEWSTVRNWLGKNAPDLCAVTIGKRPKGWWVIRWVVVGEPEDDIFTTAAPLHTYLVTKRKWQTKATTMEMDAKRLTDHYLTRYEDDEETFSVYVPEMFDTYRSQLAMPKTSRTYRTDGVKEVLEQQSLPVSNNAAFVINGIHSDSTSKSGMALCEVKVKRGIVKEAHWVCAEYHEGDPFDDLREVTDDSESEF